MGQVQMGVVTLDRVLHIFSIAESEFDATERVCAQPVENL